MKVSRRSLVFLFVLFSIVVPIAAYLCIVHSPVDDIFLDIALILYGIFVVCCIYRIYHSEIMAKSEKWMYGIAVVFLGWLGGLLYLLFAEKRQVYRS